MRRCNAFGLGSVQVPAGHTMKCQTSSLLTPAAWQVWISSAPAGQMDLGVPPALEQDSLPARRQVIVEVQVRSHCRGSRD